MLESLRVIWRGLVAQLAEHLPGQQTVSWDRILAQIIEKNEVARPGRLELPTLCLEGRRSIQLSYGRVIFLLLF